MTQVREAYLQFMVSIAKITREDRNLTQDEERLWEEMTQVLELETDIANVSLEIWKERESVDGENAKLIEIKQKSVKSNHSLRVCFFKLSLMN